jgi:hypothetical protein
VVGFHGDFPRSLESKLSDRLSFSVRWAGLLQLVDHVVVFGGAMQNFADVGHAGSSLSIESISISLHGICWKR